MSIAQQPKISTN